MKKVKNLTSSRDLLVPRVPSFLAPALVLMLSLLVPAVDLLCALDDAEPDCAAAGGG